MIIDVRFENIFTVFTMPFWYTTDVLMQRCSAQSFRWIPDRRQISPQIHHTAAPPHPLDDLRAQSSVELSLRLSLGFGILFSLA